jgi:DNA-binding CsgD family transcriptional regulator
VRERLEGDEKGANEAPTAYQVLFVEVMGQLSNHNTRLRFEHLRRLRTTDIAQLVDAYPRGATLKELAEEYGIHLTTVSAILERVQVRRRGRPLSSIDIEEAIRMYQSGQSLSVVSSQFRVSADTIRHHLSRAGLKLRDAARQNQRDL